MSTAKLHVGEIGDAVARLHQTLAQHGLAVAPQELKRRFFGPSTRDAVIAFQKRNTLDASGAIDAPTAAAFSAAAPAPAPAPRILPAVLAGLNTGVLDKLSVAVFEATAVDPCADPAPSGFATDQQILQTSVAANTAVELSFGPANAGPGIVTVEMYPSLVTPAPPPQLHVQFARRAGAVGGGGVTAAAGNLASVIARDNNTGPGGGGGNPGGGALPQGAFRIELLPPGQGAAAVATGPAPLLFTLPPPQPGRLPGVTAIGRDPPNWKLRITNTTTVNATGRVFVTFVGNRPILQKGFDLDALNHLLCRVIGGSAPMTVAFENRRLKIGGSLGFETTWLIVLPNRDMQRQFGVHEFDLGMKILNQRYESAPMKVHLVVNDGRLAFKTRIDFPYGTTLLIENLVGGLVASAIGPGGGGNIVSAAIRGALSAIEQTLSDQLVNMLVGKSEAKIKTLSADIMFTMRDQSLSGLEGPPNNCDILVRPYIDLEDVSPTLTMLVATLIEGFLGRAYDFGNPAYDSLAKLRGVAGTIWNALGHYLLARDLPEIARQSASTITQSFVGDRPQGPMFTTGDGAPPDAPLPDPGLLANIDHIVVLMMENRSFDQALGHLSLPVALGGLGRTDVHGLRGTEFNLRPDGSRAYVFPFTHAPATLFGYDPGHSFSDQLIQRGGQKLSLPQPPRPKGKGDPDPDEDPVSNDVTVPPMGGFVIAHGRRLAHKYSAGELADASRNYGAKATDIMGYHLPASVPMYSFLAENYLICDHWYAAHPGDTWPNRFITLTGNLAPKPPHDPHAGSPEIGTPDPQDYTPVHVKTIFDHLDEAQVGWRYYEHDVCMLRLFADYTLGHPNIVQINDPLQGLEAAARAGTLPSVVFIDPDLTDIPAGNDDHPPTDMAFGQRLIKRVHDALAASPLWEKTLLIVTYDEYGGFHDHVLPREVSDPNDPEYVSPMFSFPQFAGQAPPGQFHPVPVHYRGVRVPTFIVSPWVQKRGVSHLSFDHTSILKTIVTRFLHANPPHLGERVSRAHGLEQVLSAPRIQVGGGATTALAKAVARAAAVSPRLAPAPVAPVSIPPGHATDDFRTLVSTLRDRHGLRR